MFKFLETKDSLEIEFCERCTNLFIDKINKLLIIETKKLFSENFIETFRFSDVSHIDYSSATDRDDMLIFGSNIISLQDDTIWSYACYDEDKAYKLNQKLCKILNTKMYRSVESKYKRQCPQCSRTISNISKHCIYCGEKFYA